MTPSTWPGSWPPWSAAGPRPACWRATRPSDARWRPAPSTQRPATWPTLAPELSDPRLTGDDGQFEQARPAAAAAIQAAKASEFHSLGLTLGYDYGGSPLVTPDRHPRPAPPRGNGDYTPTAAPGHRLPHRWLAPGDSLYDHLGREFTLAGDWSAPGAARLAAAGSALGVPLHRLDLDGADARRRFGAALVLVRPDQHVAWRGDNPADPAAILGRAVGRPV